MFCSIKHFYMLMNNSGLLIILFSKAFNKAALLGRTFLWRFGFWQDGAQVIFPNKQSQKILDAPAKIVLRCSGVIAQQTQSQSRDVLFTKESNALTVYEDNQPFRNIQWKFFDKNGNLYSV